VVRILRVEARHWRYAENLKVLLPQQKTHRRLCNRQARHPLKLKRAVEQLLLYVARTVYARQLRILVAASNGAPLHLNADSGRSTPDHCQRDRDEAPELLDLISRKEVEWLGWKALRCAVPKSITDLARAAVHRLRESGIAISDRQMMLLRTASGEDGLVLT